MKLALQPLNMEDIELVDEMYNDEAVFQTAILGYNYPQSRLLLKGKLESWITNKSQKHFKIMAEEAVGIAQIHDIHGVNRTCKLGIMIKPAFWGKGYGPEVLRQLEQICFNDIGLRRIEAEVLATNERVLAMMEQGHYEREGVRKEAVFKNGRFVDVHYYGKINDTSMDLGRYDLGKEVEKIK
ncbi:GNAT family N-acetyltransferase [Shouchella clausii]|uniref:GNAT family N-acetyltransferase n=1 Tax=Shouchella clausii TaxID=79880 RepID=UPI0007977C5B|nr:GNAT family protein [Shouchella clausii]KKI88335.1 hypothetical protein WZ76_00770 [Shouchella clausii]